MIKSVMETETLALKVIINLKQQEDRQQLPLNLPNKQQRQQ